MIGSRKFIVAAAALGLGIAVVGCKNNKEAGEKEVTVAQSEVPSAVRTAFMSAHPNVTVSKVERETMKNGTVAYEYKYKDATNMTHEAKYDSNGMMMKEEK